MVRLWLLLGFLSVQFSRWVLSCVLESWNQILMHIEKRPLCLIFSVVRVKRALLSPGLCHRLQWAPNRPSTRQSFFRTMNGCWQPCRWGGGRRRRSRSWLQEARVTTPHSFACQVKSSLISAVSPLLLQFSDLIWITHNPWAADMNDSSSHFLKYSAVWSVV